MTLTANLRIGTGIALANITLASAALALPSTAAAQILEPMTDADIRALPSQYQSGPVINDFEEVTVAPDGTETITRTRRIETDAPYPHSYSAPATAAPAYVEETVHTYAPAHASHAGAYGYAPGAAVFQRDQWISECERRTARSGDREKGGIIGALLGGITGGIIGNRVAGAGERLAGSLIGGGAGAIGGLVLGQLIGGGRNDRGEYDCAAALDGYLSQYGHAGTYGAVRTIPAQVYAPAPAYHGYGYAPAHHSYGYSYAPPQQIVYVPIHYQQQQRVIVRETVREEVIPGAVRQIPARPPIPVKGPAPRPAPPRYIKGN